MCVCRGAYGRITALGPYDIGQDVKKINLEKPNGSDPDPDLQERNNGSESDRLWIRPESYVKFSAEVIETNKFIIIFQSF